MCDGPGVGCYIQPCTDICHRWTCSLLYCWAITDVDRDHESEVRINWIVKSFFTSLGIYGRGRIFKNIGILVFITYKLWILTTFDTNYQLFLPADYQRPATWLPGGEMIMTNKAFDTKGKLVESRSIWMFLLFTLFQKYVKYKLFLPDYIFSCIGSSINLVTDSLTLGSVYLYKLLYGKG